MNLNYNFQIILKQFGCSIVVVLPWFKVQCNLYQPNFDVIFRTMMLSTMTVQINQENNNNQNCEEATNDLNDYKKEKM